MKDLNSLSGPWTGLSVQGMRRLTECLKLEINCGKLWGKGSDVDGDFVLEGVFEAGTYSVLITRQYMISTISGDHIGVPFDYEGHWDGSMIVGRWMERDFPSNCGPFEMWPDSEEDRQELRIAFEDAEKSSPLPAGFH